jgi:hypothetical protein
LSVTNELIKAARKEGFSDPLLKVIGLAHDIEKILAYKKKDGKWKLDATHYHQLGVAVIKSIPSYGFLEESDRVTINRVLRFSHSPEKLPVGSTERQRKLIELLRKADQSQTKKEKASSPGNISIIASEDDNLRDAIFGMIPELNINESIRTGRADGWTLRAHTYVIVIEENLRALLKEKGDADLLSFLNLNIPFSRDGSHPATKAIAETLSREGLLLMKHENITSDSGLFDVRNGSIPFKGVFLLSKEAIKRRYPEIIEKWGSSKYRVVIQASHQISDKNPKT